MMKKTKLFLLTSVFILANSFSYNLAVYSKEYTLTQNQKQKLKSLKIPIVLPKYLPANFSFNTINTTNSHGDISYDIVFKDKSKHSITISGVSDGLGGVDYSPAKKIKSKFGTFNLYFEPKNMADNVKVANCSFIDWYEYKKKFYRFRSGCGVDNRISQDEAIKVISSFSEIKL